MSRLRYDVAISRAPMLALFEARGREPALEAGVRASGLAWPQGRNRFEPDAGGAGAVRIGPARALVIAPIEREAALGEALTRAFAGRPEADVAMVSDMHAVFSVGGPGALDVLRQGAPLDLSPGAFPPGAVAGTELWSVTVLILRGPEPEPRFTLLVDNSFAGYLEDWLAVASGAPSTLRPGVMSHPPRPLNP